MGNLLWYYYNTEEDGYAITDERNLMAFTPFDVRSYIIDPPVKISEEQVRILLQLVPNVVEDWRNL